MHNANIEIVVVSVARAFAILEQRGDNYFVAAEYRVTIAFFVSRERLIVYSRDGKRRSIVAEYW